VETHLVQDEPDGEHIGRARRLAALLLWRRVRRRAHLKNAREILASPSELLASPSELSASPREV
jgi:hypothetical protein